jgi:hypothetical protein
VKPHTSKGQEKTSRLIYDYHGSVLQPFQFFLERFDSFERRLEFIRRGPFPVMSCLGDLKGYDKPP